MGRVIHELDWSETARSWCQEKEMVDKAHSGVYSTVRYKARVSCTEFSLQFFVIFIFASKKRDSVHAIRAIRVAWRTRGLDMIRIRTSWPTPLGRCMTAVIPANRWRGDGASRFGS